MRKRFLVISIFVVGLMFSFLTGSLFFFKDYKEEYPRSNPADKKSEDYIGQEVKDHDGDGEPDMNIILNGGVSETKEPTLEITVQGFADKMKLSENSLLSDAQWRDCKKKMSFTLQSYHGEHTVYAKFLYHNGLEGDTVYSQSIFYNRYRTITYHGNGHDGGSVPEDTNDYTNGQNVFVCSNENSLTKSGYTFWGWSNQSGAVYQPAASLTVSNEDIDLYAYWRSVSEFISPPRFSPPGGIYTHTTNVSISSETPLADIFYTTDGSVPDHTSKQYDNNNPIFVTTNMTLRAIAMKVGLSNSVVSSANYIITDTFFTPEFETYLSRNYSLYHTTTNIIISTTTPDASIYYTLDGSVPDTNSLKYTNALILDPETNISIRAKVFNTGYSNLDMISGTYIVSEFDISLGGFGRDGKSYSTATIGVYSGTNDVVVIPEIFGDYEDYYYLSHRAFQSNSNVTHIKVPDNMDKMYDETFMGCTSLRTAVIGDGITNIPEKAFYGCVGLTNIGFGTNVKQIGQEAFAECKRLEEITLGGEINWIKSSAFKNNFRLRQVTIGSNVEIIENAVFYNCTNLISVTMLGENPPQLYDWSGSSFGQNAAGRKIYVPSNAVDHYRTADYWSNYADEIIAFGVSGETAAPLFSPESGTYSNHLTVTLYTATSDADIYYTFDGGDPLTEGAFYTNAIRVKSNLTIKAAAKKSGLSNSLISTETYILKTHPPVFSLTNGTYGTPQLLSLTNGLSGAKIYFTTNGSIPDQSSTEFTNSFLIDADLTIHAVSVKDGWSDSDMISNHYRFDYPDVAVPEFSLSGGTFIDASKSVTLTCDTDGAEIYFTTNGLNPTSNDIKYTNSLMIDRTTTLKAVAMKNGYFDDSAVTNVYYEFRTENPVITPDVSNHTTNINISITCSTPGSDIYYTIDNSSPTDADMKYTNLLTLYVETNVTIKAVAIRSGRSDSSVVEQAYTLELEYFSYTDIGGEIRIDSYSEISPVSVTIPDEINRLPVTVIGDSAFYYKSTIKNISLSQNLLRIGESAFSNCRALTNILIPDGVTNIEKLAFRNCTNLRRIELPDSVTSLGSQVFRDCSGLQKVIIGGGMSRVGSSAFWDCESLTNVVFGTNIKTIHDYAFRECHSLTSLTLPQGLQSIINFAFYQCSSLSNIDFNTNLGLLSGFFDCDSLVTLDIPDSVTNIGYKAFMNCGGLKEAQIGSNVGIIGEMAYWNCDSLTNIFIPPSVTVIGERAFDSCGYVKNVTIGTNVGWIKNYAFNDLHDDLTNIFVPGSVTNIGSGAFYYNGGGSGRVIRMESSVPPVVGNDIINMDGWDTIEVPSGSKTIYTNASNWVQYADHIQEY